MIEINVSYEQLERAKELYNFKVLNNSISKGKGKTMEEKEETIKRRITNLTRVT